MKTPGRFAAAVGTLLLATSLVGSHIQPIRAASATLQPTTTTLTSNNSFPFTWSSLTLSGTVAPNTTYGLVTLSDTYTNYYGVKQVKVLGQLLLFRGHYAINLPPYTLPAGTNVFTAKYAGNAVYGASVARLTQIVQAGGHS
jgi:hypothetical protein